MTFEHRFLLELTDILAVRLECKKCGATLGFPPSQGTVLPPAECKSCSHVWMQTGSAADKGLRALFDNLRQLRADAEGLGFRIKLEFEGPSKILGA